MKTVKRTLIFVGVLIAAFVTFLVIEVSSHNGKATMAETPKLISYKVVNRRESGSTKLSLIVEVPLVDGRPPYERELRDLSNHLVGSEKRYHRKFVTFYLPGMKHGEGAFATGHHNPDLQVYLRPYTLAQYPEYAKFAF